MMVNSWRCRVGVAHPVNQKLSLAEIETMVNEMLRQNRDYLPAFKHFAV